MSCYHPYIAAPTGRLTEKGNIEFRIVGLVDTHPAGAPYQSDEIFIPCGKCLGCRLDYSRKWADRMMLELDHTKKAIFVTLTYNNEHVPQTDISYDGEYLGDTGAFTLCKRDLQLFFKRLRKRFPDKEIRYYAAGEYGSNTDRPHYHAIIFGLGLEDLGRLRPVGKNDLGQAWFTCESLENTWSIRKYRLKPVIGKKGFPLKKLKKEYYYDPIGFVSVSEVSWQTCAYVSRYVQKKVFGGALWLQEKYDCDPEFSVMSRNPGISGYYLEDHPDAKNLSVLYVDGYEDGIQFPRYFLDMLKDDKKKSLYDSVLYAKLSEERKKFAKDKVLLKLMQTDLTFEEQLELEENRKFHQLGALRRDRIDRQISNNVY